MKTVILLGCVLLLFPVGILSQNCPEGTTSPPTGTNIVQVEIISFKPNSDMEGGDEYIPFYNNKADIFGRVTIAGESFDLPKMEDDNFPHWGSEFVIEKEVFTDQVMINLKLTESDGGATGDDDTIDINPESGKSELDVMFDLCAWTVSGDVTKQTASDEVEVNSGNNDDQGTLKFRVTTKRGSPVTSDDLALTDVRFVQVVYDPAAMATWKPTVVMARIANNYNTVINTNFNITIAGSGMNVQESFPITLQPNEVLKEHFFVNNPIRFNTNTVGTNQVAYLAWVEDPGSVSLDPKDCKIENDGTRNRRPISVTQVRRDFKILWAKTGTLLDGFNMTPDSQFNEIYDLGSSYIDVIYPMPIHHVKGDNAIVPPLSGGLLAFVTTIISPFVPDEIDPRVAEPFAMIIELDGIAHVAGYDRIMGVLPSWSWFDRYPYFEDVTGLSLGEYQPRAVLFEPKGENNGPALTLPAHELGHTFSLSVDTRLKAQIDNSWACDIDWPVIGNAGCGIVGGFDEYKFPDDNLKKGIPSAGFWIEQGKNSPELASLVNQEQCDATCMMASSPGNVHLNWNSNRKWIDNPDYNHILKKISTKPETTNNSLYISGLISANDSIFIANIFKKPEEEITYPKDTTGVYQIIFIDETGKSLKRENIPLQWKYMNDSLVMPITPFALKTDYNRNYDHFVIRNRHSKAVLTKQSLKSKPPKITRLRKKVELGQRGITVSWRAKDKDNDKLQFMVMASSRGKDWIPLTSWITNSSYTFDNSSQYRLVKIIAWDKINVAESDPLRL